MLLWDKYDRHFKSNISVYNVTYLGKAFARVLFKHSESNNTCFCCIHAWGFPPGIGQATGYGYDKESAAFQDALSKCVKESSPILLRWQTSDESTNWRFHIEGIPSTEVIGLL